MNQDILSVIASFLCLDDRKQFALVYSKFAQAWQIIDRDNVVCCTMENAIRHNHLLCVRECLRKTYWRCGRTIKYADQLRFTYDAAYYGSFEVLKFLHERAHCRVNVHQAYGAALQTISKGGFECFQYIYVVCSQRKWIPRLCERAAKGGNLACLKFAHENGCPWHGSTVCMMADMNGHVDCLEYAEEQGCSWNRTCLRTTSLPLQSTNTAEYALVRRMTPPPKY